MSHIIDTINDTGNSVEVICTWDATTGQLGRAAFAHHLVYPTDMVVVTPSILDLFTFDREVGRYIPLFSTVEAAVDHFTQTISTVLTELLSLPAPPRVIFADLVGVDTLAWAPVFGDFAVQGLMTRSPGSTPGVVSPAFPSDAGSCTHARPRTASSGSMISGL